MVEALVGSALRAALVSIVSSGALALLALAATRVLALKAGTRHAIWMAVLVASAIMPLAGIGASLVRAAPAHPADDAVSYTLVPAQNAVGPYVKAPPRLRPARAHAASAASTGSAASRSAEVASTSALAGAARWAPPVSRTTALAVLGAWALGALIGVLSLAASVLRVRGLRRRSSPLDGELADELPWLTAVGPGREIYVRLSYETETPVAIGFRRPVVLIPTELATADGLTAIEPLVLHEHAHLRHYDDWTNLVQRVVERVFWFNPVVWLVGRRIALEREIAADDAVVAATGAPKAYAASLWQLAREMRMPEHAVVAPGALLTRKQISVRIERLLDANRARLRDSRPAALGAATAGVLAVLLVATSAPALELPPPAAPAIAAASPVPIVAPLRVAPPARAVAAPARLDGVKLSRELVASCTACSLRRSDGRGVDLHGLTIDADDFREADLRGVNLNGARIEGVSFAGADLSNADLRGADLTGDELRGAKLDGALLDGARFVGVSLRTVSLRGTALRGVLANCSGCDLSHLDLRGQDLRGISLNGADLSHSDLRDANLAGARFNAVDLSHANFAGADLRDARFEACDMSQVDLRGARTAGMQLHRSGLE